MTGLHLVSLEEGERLAMREAALTQFKRRYRHNAESQRAMVGALRRVASTFSQGREDEQTFAWEYITDEAIAEAVLAPVADRYSRATLVKDASALRVMLNCCRKVGLVTHDEYDSVTKLEVLGGQTRRPPGRYLSEADVATLVRAAASTARHEATRTRDLALVLTLASTGARGHEVSRILLHHTFLGERRVHLQETKSGIPRNAWLHPAAVGALERWLEFRGTGRGALFPPLSRTGRALIDHGPMSTHQVWKLVNRHAEVAELPGTTVHDLRRFVITTLLDNGYDIALVAKTVGHAHPTTTAGYDKRPGQRQRDAIAAINLPLG